MAHRQSGLWAEVALALVLITLVTIVLNAGVFWLLTERGVAERRADFAVTAARNLRAQVEAVPRAKGRAAWRGVLRPYRETGLGIEELWIVDRDLTPLASVAGTPPDRADPGLRAALYAHQEYIDVAGTLTGRRRIVVTEPLRFGGALRLVMPWSFGEPVGGRLGFLFSYTAVCGGLVALFGFTLLQKRLIAPIRTILEATHRIAGGGFGTPVRVEAARELTELAGALTSLSMSLAAYRERTTEQLERLEEANRQLVAAQETLVRSERLASVGRLAAGVAHEVGNPLSSLVALLELLVGGGLAPEEERDLLRRARDEAERIGRIVRELVDYARPDEEGPAPLDLPALLQDALGTVRHQASFREVEVELELPGELPPVRGRAHRLHQVVVNLLLNAAEAMEGRGCIRVAVEAGEGEVVVACRDEGPGFTPEALEQAFEPFFTTRPPGKGTGLGLAVCRRIVEEEGGWIALGNRPEGGGEVRFGLPLDPPEASA